MLCMSLLKKWLKISYNLNKTASAKFNINKMQNYVHVICQIKCFTNIKPILVVKVALYSLCYKFHY